tara:strand:+ start:567 stop:728 length:162 start_codon:yes stop_codon:yes gene_type:complete
MISGAYRFINTNYAAKRGKTNQYIRRRYPITGRSTARFFDPELERVVSVCIGD